MEGCCEILKSLFVVVTKAEAGEKVLEEMGRFLHLKLKAAKRWRAIEDVSLFFFFFSLKLMVVRMEGCLDEDELVVLSLCQLQVW